MLSCNENADSSQHFLFENQAVRGELIHLDASYQAILAKQPYPKSIQRWLGEILAMSALLSSNVKDKGSITIQLHGNNQLQLLLAQCDHRHHIRGLAKWHGKIGNKGFKTAAGEGKLMLALDIGKHEHRYNAIVELSGKTLDACFENYFMRSEQIPTVLKLAANGRRAAGLLLQKIPGKHAEEDELFWQEIAILSRSLRDEELLTLSNQDILHRLYHEHDLRVFDPDPVSFRCHCSIKRIERTILALGYHQVIQEFDNNQLEIICEFCNQHYHFDLIDIENIFASGKGSSALGSSVQH